MKIIIHDYYKLNLKSKLVIFLLEYKKRIIFNRNDFKKEGTDAFIKLESFQYCKYRINLSDFKNVDFEILFQNKSIFYKKAPICYFDFINKDKINVLSKDDYNKNESLIKKNRNKSSMKFWHLYWNCLHYLSYSYPDNPNFEDKKQIINLVEKMKKNGIACSYCKGHFNIWCAHNKITNCIDDKNYLINFFIDLHNDINKRNNKKVLSRNEVDDIYLNFNYKYLLNYGLDIITLFNNRTLYKFPDIINSYTRHVLLDEFNIIKFA